MATYKGKEVTILEPAIVIKQEDNSIKTVPAKEVTFKKDEALSLLKGKL